jgi:hypothetical protein
MSKQSDWDTRARQYATARGKSSHRNAATSYMRKMTDGTLAPSSGDQKYIAVPGRYVPIGFGRYVSPVVDPSDYALVQMMGWRIAVPRSTTEVGTRDLMLRIYTYGPQSAGYVRHGDTLVPSILSTGDRATIGQAAGAQDPDDYEPFPATPT